MKSLGKAADPTAGHEPGSVSTWFNPLSAEFRDDPYPYYRRLREEAPVFEFLPGIFGVVRYDDCASVFRDHRRFGNDASKSDLYTTLRPGPRGVKGLGQTVGAGGGLVMMDPPDHTRLRGLVQQAFTARVVEQLRPRIQEHVDRLLDRMAGRDDVDLVHEFAYPLPLTVVCELLGIPPADWELFQRWSDDLVPTLEWVVTADLAKKAFRATREFRIYLLKRIQERETQPGDDLLSSLIDAELDGSKLTRGELIALSMNLVIAGHETTVNLISNGVLDLLGHPDQLALFRESDPATLRTAVDEFLRFDAPVQNAGRIVLEDVEIGGREIRKGQHVIVVIGSANRDPDQFPDPDRFDITRQDNRHLTFAAGIHRCIGAALGHTEVQIAMSSLFRRYPKLRLATDRIERRETLILRGPLRLPVHLS